MSTSTSAKKRLKTEGCLTLAELRDRAETGRPVQVVSFDLNYPTRPYQSFVSFPEILKGDRVGFKGAGPLPRYLKPDDKLLSVWYRDHTSSFFGLVDTPAIAFEFIYSCRHLTAPTDVVERECLIIALPEIPVEADSKGVCLGLFYHEGETKIVRVSKAIMRQPMRIINPRLDDSDSWKKQWPVHEMGKQIMSKTKMVPVWTTEWTVAHDRVRRQKAKKLAGLQLPHPPDDAKKV